jgi:hypothetical protein
MSNSASTITYNAFPKGIIPLDNAYKLYGTITIGSGTYPTNGVTLSFSTASSAPNIQEPYAGVFWSPSSGYVYQFDPVHDTIRVYESAGSAAPLTEISGSTPSGVTGDTIYFEVTCQRN